MTDPTAEPAPPDHKRDDPARWIVPHAGPARREQKKDPGYTGIHRDPSHLRPPVGQRLTGIASHHIPLYPGISRHIPDPFFCSRAGCRELRVVDEARNAAAATRLAEERPYLRPLPSARIPEYTTFQCVVRKWSTIRVGGRIYSVPSRLIGHTVEARQHPSTVEVRYGGQLLCTMPRLRGAADHRIDYRHIIGSLVRKPGAFARYRFREELFPSLTFRAAYDALGRTHGERADVEYVRLLHLAATTSERQVEVTLRSRLDAGAGCDYASVQAEVRPPVPTIPVVHIPRPDLSRYDALLTGGLRR